MIVLRELEEKDAPLMLEWMHDPDIQRGFRKRMLDATLGDAQRFIKTSRITEKPENGANLNFAIIDQNDDEYLGTVSLKNIDTGNKTAEFAIILRKKAQGRGIAYNATKLILKKAFEDIGLRRVYLAVYSNNEAAIRLYEKSGFKYEGEFRNHFIIDGEPVGWKWYGILREEYNEKVR